MFEINISTKQGTKVNGVVCSAESCLIGKDPDCLITLHGWKISKVHAKLNCRDDGVFISDAGSVTGISVNGVKCQEYGPLKSSDVIAIHSYRLRVKMHKSVTEPLPAPQKDLVPGRQDALAEPGNLKEIATAAAGQTLIRQAQEWRSHIHKLLLEQMDLRRLNTFEMEDIELRRLTAELITQVMNNLPDLPPVAGSSGHSGAGAERVCRSGPPGGSVGTGRYHRDYG